MNDGAMDAYAEYFGSMTRDSLSSLGSYMTEDARFVDPFNDVSGLDKVRKILDHMFENLTDARFTVTHYALDARDASAGLLRWELHAGFRGKAIEIKGMSEVRFAPDGRVSLHVDHWDSGRQFYEHLPIVGWLLRVIRKRLQAA